MTSSGRLKRSCFGAALVVFASALAVFILAVLENGGKGGSLGVGDAPLDVLGLPLAPGWFMVRGMLEKINLSSLNQMIVPVLLLLFISVVFDTALIFAVWELSHWTLKRGTGSESRRHI